MSVFLNALKNTTEIVNRKFSAQNCLCYPSPFSAFLEIVQSKRQEVLYNADMSAGEVGSCRAQSRMRRVLWWMSQWCSVGFCRASVIKWAFSPRTHLAQGVRAEPGEENVSERVQRGVQQQ